VEVCGGKFPREVDALRQLPGIGPYTAGAIACFAFELDTAFVDTNMRRVLHRLFVGVDVPAPTASERDVLRLAAAAVPPANGWEWNQALIEFGALQCTARKPACVVCPLQSACCAFPAVQTALAELPRGVRLKREAPFDGSNRFYRGRVLAVLRDLPDDDTAEREIDLRSLGPSVRNDFTDADVPWLHEVVQGLAKDGLAKVAEDRPVYDAGHAETDDRATCRVRLP
jgi:A/G-specific adenine glycosylase